MGRLTLNVLLSFAQFEREVTGERIRDKVAASKKKGMWMGGTVPMGYDLSEHSLVVNEVEAKQVREIFKQYLRLGSVFDLHEHLSQTDIRSKRRVSLTGRSSGGAILARGMLYHLLSNPLYIGKVAHKGDYYPGRHKAIVDELVWHKAADLLKANRVNRSKAKNLPSGRLLLGLLYDSDGKGFTPSHSSKSGRRYSYYIYISQTAIAKRKSKVIQRIPATEIEQVIAVRVQSLLSTQLELSKWFSALPIKDLHVLNVAGKHCAEQLTKISSPEAGRLLRRILRRVIVHENELSIELNRDALLIELLGPTSKDKFRNEADECIHLTCPFAVKRRGQQVRIVLSAGEINKAQGVPSLMKAVARSRHWADLIVAGKARTIGDLVKISGLNKRYVRRILHCAALSPQLVESILNGRHPVDLTVLRLIQNLPLDWHEQQLG